jgi:Cof subfamily protein (haloacid dehalogenase superfamily)
VRRRPRLIATDLDGTLLRTGGSVSERTRAALASVRRLRIPVVLVTGRPVRWLAVVYDQLVDPLPAICANGAVRYDPATDTLTEQPIAVGTVREVYRRLRAAEPDLTFAVELDGGRAMFHEHTYPVRQDNRSDVFAVDPAQLFERPVTKLLARAPHNTRDPDELAATVSSIVGELVLATHSSTSGLVEMSAAGISKASALASYAGELDIGASDVLAFGDMPNDIPMLAWAGHSVAVAGAHPEVRAIADEITGSNDDDGVADYLETLARL